MKQPNTTVVEELRRYLNTDRRPVGQVYRLALEGKNAGDISKHMRGKYKNLSIAAIERELDFITALLTGYWPATDKGMMREVAMKTCRWLDDNENSLLGRFSDETTCYLQSLFKRATGEEHSREASRRMRDDFFRRRK